MTHCRSSPAIPRFGTATCLAFRIRVYASGRKIWCVQTRGPAGGPKRFALGRYGEMAPDEGRRKAAAMIDRIKRGLDPNPPQPAPESTVA